MRTVLHVLAATVISLTASYGSDGFLKPETYWKCPAAEAPGVPKPPGFGARIQARFSATQSGPHQPTWLVRDDNDGGDDYNTRRLRLKYFGQTEGNLAYFIQGRRDWGADEFELHDAYVTYDRGEGPKLTIGQMMTPFDRQFLTSDVHLPLVHRARTTILLMPGRDIGLLAHDADCTETLGWYAGLFTGNGKNELDFDSDLMPVLRAEWMAEPHLNIGANWMRKPNASVSKFDKFMTKNGDPYSLQSLYDDEQVDEEAWGLDMLYRRGCTSVWAGYTEKQVSGPAGTTVDASGWHIEGTKFMPFEGRTDKLEIAVGYEDFDPNEAVTDQLDARWLTFGVNYHIRGCKRQVRLQYVLRDEARDEVDNDTVVLQYEHIFK